MSAYWGPRVLGVRSKWGADRDCTHRTEVYSEWLGANDLVWWADCREFQCAWAYSYMTWETAFSAARQHSRRKVGPR